MWSSDERLSRIESAFFSARALGVTRASRAGLGLVLERVEALDENKQIAGVQDAAVVPAIPEKTRTWDKTVVRAEALKKRLSRPAEAQEDVSADPEQGTKASKEPQKGVP